MANLTEVEYEELCSVAVREHRKPPISPEIRFVAPTPKARLRYIRRDSKVSKFVGGEKPRVVQVGDGWRL